MQFEQNNGDSLEELLRARAHILEQIDIGKQHLDRIDQAVALITGASVMDAYGRANKADGVVRFQHAGKTYKADTEKYVKWDSGLLQQIAGSLPFETARDTFKIEYSVSETMFKAADEALRKRLIAARTVRYGNPKISLDKKTKKD